MGFNLDTYRVSDARRLPILLNASGGAIYMGYTADPTSGNKLAVNGNGYFAGNVTATGKGTFGGGGNAYVAINDGEVDTWGSGIKAYKGSNSGSLRLASESGGVQLYDASMTYTLSIYDVSTLKIRFSADSTLDSYINAGNFFIGYTTDPTSGNKLAVNGNGYFAGNITATGEVTAWTASDMRLKENVQPILNANQLISQFRPITHYWNGLAKELNPAKDNRLNYGLIAQEVQAIAPEFVHPLYGDYLSIDYVSFVPLLIAGEQEHEVRIKQLEARVKELENELNQYRRN